MGHAADVASLARDFGISTRQLERRFADSVGLPPKLYARMRRFQSVFPAIESGAPWDRRRSYNVQSEEAGILNEYPPAAPTSR